MSQAIHSRVQRSYRFPPIWKAYSRFLVERANNMFDRKRMISELKALKINGDLSKIIDLFEDCYRDLMKIEKDCTTLMPSFCVSQHYTTPHSFLVDLLEKTGVSHERLIEGFANPCDTFAPKCCSLFGGDYHDFFAQDLTSFPRETVWLINPPFTEVLLEQAARKLTEAQVSYIFICPNWNCQANRILEENCDEVHLCEEFHFPKNAPVQRGNNPEKIFNKGCKVYLKLF